jgi:hypothetical protein
MRPQMNRVDTLWIDVEVISPLARRGICAILQCAFVFESQTIGFSVYLDSIVALIIFPFAVVDLSSDLHVCLREIASGYCTR